MQLSSKWIVPLSSAGYGVLLSLAICGVAHLASMLARSPISDQTANSLFGISCLVLVPITTYFRVASLFIRPVVTENN